MPLTPAQLITFKTAILAETDPAVVNGLANGDSGAIAAWYNQTASPDYWIYRNHVPTDEIRSAIWISELEGITDAKLNACLACLEVRAEKGYSGEVADDRNAWDQVFSAAAGDNSQQAIAALWTRLATNAEKVFSLSTGTGANAANADTTDFQGEVTHQDVSNALNS